jgi:hypothetical protein
VASLVAPKSEEKLAFSPAGFPLLSGLEYVLKRTNYDNLGLATNYTNFTNFIRFKFLAKTNKMAKLCEILIRVNS